MMQQDREQRAGEASSLGTGESRYALVPITVTHPEHVDPRRIKLFRTPPWILRLTLEGDRCYTRVKVVRAAPLSYPRRFICLLDSKDEEICMIDDLDEVDEDLRTVVEEELSARYLYSTILRINSMRNEFGSSYWDVDTDRGPREFVLRNAVESTQWIDEHRLLLTDVDGNRFEVPRVDRLDRRSSAYLQQIL